MDVLCSDKTGTLTEARIKLIKHLDINGAVDDRVLRLAWINSFFESGVRSPLDEAILQRDGSHDGWQKIDEVPFDFSRRRVSVLVDHVSERLLIVKGAPEEIFKLCNAYMAAGANVASPLDDEALTRARRLFEDLSKEGFRLLAVGWRVVDTATVHAAVKDEEFLTLAGFVAFLDPPKESAKSALNALKESGIEVKVLTGDNELVTQHVCHQLGIPIKGLLLGSDLQSLGDEALLNLVEKTNLFCRVNPAQKDRIIAALKKRGHTVGFLGDGINDAPSLQSANVGISVAGAVDVAKEAADMILLDHELGVLMDGVEEGRRTFGNIMKYVMMATSSNFGNMFSMAGAAVLLPFLPMRPVQILLNNFLYDLSELAIPLDTVDREVLSRPQRWDVSFIRRFMIMFGPLSSVFDFLMFGVLIWGFKADEKLFQTGWFVESLATQILVIFVIRTRGGVTASPPHGLLVALAAGVIATALMIPYLPVGAWFTFVPLPLHLLIAVAAMTIVYLLMAELLKRYFYKKMLAVRSSNVAGRSMWP
jgi:Mg2+-importing ATPase